MVMQYFAPTVFGLLSVTICSADGQDVGMGGTEAQGDQIRNQAVDNLLVTPGATARLPPR
jgi:hypothetical protein